VVSLPPLHAAQAALREITSGPEPTTYEHRRSILEGIIDLRMNYYDGDLEIRGKIPVPDAKTVSPSTKKNWYSRIGANSQCQGQPGGDGEPRISPQSSQGIQPVVCVHGNPPRCIYSRRFAGFDQAYYTTLRECVARVRRALLDAAAAAGLPARSRLRGRRSLPKFCEKFRWAAAPRCLGLQLLQAKDGRVQVR